MKKSKKSAYAKSGVDINNNDTAVETVKRLVKATHKHSKAIGGIGLFGGMFPSPGKDFALVASADGVGTKLKVAVMAGRHDTVGQDLINHCVNDILAQGASPLFFLDYVGFGRFEGKLFHDVIKGLCKACEENGCVLLGGETAEMPGLYPEKEYDLVGTIVGMVDRKKIVTGAGVRPGDVLIGLKSSGLHTNGYSLARKVIFDYAKLGIKDKLPGTTKSVQDHLLAVHRSYLKPVQAVMKSVTVQGMVHITGGGFYDNIPRILRPGIGVEVQRSSWTVPPLFRFIQQKGGVETDEMYRVFNMGIGYILFVRPKDEKATLKILRQAGCPGTTIGTVTRSKKAQVTLV